MLKRKWILELPYLLLGLGILVFLCTHTPNLEYDAPTYIRFDPTRPPLYPLFIWLFHWAGLHQFSLLIWTQGILLFATLLYTRYWLKKNFFVSDFLIFLIFLIILLTISFRFQITNVQSEGLTFPIFIWTFFLLIECFQQFNLKKISYLALWVSVLALTRLQFYYFYALFGLLCLWYLWQHISIKSLSIAAFILFGSMIFTVSIDHTYHYIKHGTFSGAPYGGLLVLAQTLYLANHDAANYFNDPAEKAYVKSLFEQRDAQHLNQDADLLTDLRPTYYDDAYQTYSRNQQPLTAIIESTLKLKELKHFKSNKIATSINKTLLQHAPKKNFFFFLWKFVKCMGGVPLFLFFMLLLIAIPFEMIRYPTRQADLLSIFLLVTTLITFLNAATISIFNPDLPIYFCYSQFMFYCLAALLVSQKMSDPTQQPYSCQPN